jgi:hypothetical protein
VNHQVRHCKKHRKDYYGILQKLTH